MLTRNKNVKTTSTVIPSRKRIRLSSQMNSVLTVLLFLIHVEVLIQISVSLAFIPFVTRFNAKKLIGVVQQTNTVYSNNTTTITAVVEPLQYVQGKESSKGLEFLSSNRIIRNTMKVKSAIDDENAGREAEKKYFDNEANDTEKSSVEDNDEIALRRKQAATRAALLSKKGIINRRSPSSSSELKRTSVGDRRIGSATKSREGSRATSRIVDSLRKTALGTSSDERSTRMDVDDTDENNNTKNNDAVRKFSQSMIKLVVEDVLKKNSPNEIQPTWDDSRLSEAFNSFGRTIGSLGETAQRNLIRSSNQLKPGAVVLESTNNDNIVVRIATPSDDVDIANLRLSVFSDFSPDLHSQFCARSCQAIAARRIRGAACVVATTTMKNRMAGCQSEIILGTAEFSFHEFYGTQLGRRRAQNTILYITEVAVNPNARRRGIGMKLLQAIETLARERGYESLYLHVDVSNLKALRLYHKSGYQTVASEHPMYLEFTTSLNLHPGAIKGRDHFLLCRNLTSNLTWFDDNRDPKNRVDFVGRLGFEIPA